MDHPQTLHPHHKSMKRVRSLKVSLIAASVFFIVVIAILYAIMLVNDKTIKMIATSNLPGDSSSLSHSQLVKSKLGFSLKYDTSIIDGSAKLVGNGPTGKYITGKSELSRIRSYDILKLTPKNAVNGDLVSYPMLTINTSPDKDFWSSLQQQVDYQGKSQIDALGVYVDNIIMTDSSVSVDSTSSVLLGSTSYKKVIYSTDNSKYGINVSTETTVYFTVKNDRPYWIILTDSNSNLSDSSMLQSVISSIIYSVLTPSSLSLGTTKLVMANSTISALNSFSLPANTSYVPDNLDQTTLLDVVAKNQPAVVRIFTLYCGDIILKSGGVTYAQNDSCMGGTGSGSIISSDGYIATCGHVVVVTPKMALIGGLDSIEKVQDLLLYLVRTNAMTDDNASSLIYGLESGDPSAISALANLGSVIPDYTVSANNIQSSYTIQLGNNPVRLDRTGSRWKIETNYMNVDAKLIDTDFDIKNATNAINGTGYFTSSDVAILKMTGTFPTVSLGSIDGLKTGDELTAIGFPGFIDNSIDTTKWQTVPTVTQGKVISIGPDAPSSGRMLVSTSVQIAEGSSGGPTFDHNGLQVGLNTYGILDCTDANCFGNGIVRDIADIKKLVNLNGIIITSGPITANWHAALDKYIAGNYSDAIKLFSKVQSEYPANYLASSLDSAARSQLGNVADTSSSVLTRNIILAILGIVISIGVFSIIGIILMLIHYKCKYKKERLDYEASLNKL